MIKVDLLQLVQSLYQQLLMLLVDSSSTGSIALGSDTDAFVTIQGLSSEMGKTTATLYNMLGMKVRSKTLNNTAATQQISTQGLASGVYIINLKAGDQAISKKVIIQ